MMKKLKLFNSYKVAIVDDEDFERCQKISWSLIKKDYIQGKFEQEMVRLHRFILWMFADDPKHVDHKDGRATPLQGCK